MLHLCAGQPLRLVREPGNQIDPNAIRVETMWGAVLGYVPRDLTAHFPHQVYIGRVHSLGQVSGNGPWGAQVHSSATASAFAFALWM